MFLNYIRQKYNEEDYNDAKIRYEMWHKKKFIDFIKYSLLFSGYKIYSKKDLSKINLSWHLWDIVRGHKKHVIFKNSSNDFYVLTLLHHYNENEQIRVMFHSDYLKNSYCCLMLRKYGYQLYYHDILQERFKSGQLKSYGNYYQDYKNVTLSLTKNFNGKNMEYIIKFILGKLSLEDICTVYIKRNRTLFENELPTLHRYLRKNFEQIKN